MKIKIGLESLNKEMSFDQICESKKKEGWHFYSIERLTETKFSVHSGKFEDVQYQTEDDIRARAISEAKKQDPSLDFEVDLVFNENTDKLRNFKKVSTHEEYLGILKDLSPSDRSYLVFIRTIGK